MSEEEPSKELPDDPQSLWQDLPVDEVDLSIEEIRARAGKFQSTIRRRNIRELIGLAFVVAGFSYYIVRFQGILFRAGCVLIMLGGAYAVWVLIKRGGSSAPPRSGLETCIAFHKKELEKQRDLLNGIWRWYLGPFIPGLVLFELGSAIEHHTPLWAVGSVGLLVVLVFAFVARLNGNAARKAQREIDAISRQG